MCAGFIVAPFGERDTWKELSLAGLEFEAGILEGLTALTQIDSDNLLGADNIGTPIAARSVRTRGGPETIGTAAEGFATYTVIDQDEFKDARSHFIRTEMNLLCTLLNRRGIASTAMVDRLRRLALAG